jgi:hypothetical protein
MQAVPSTSGIRKWFARWTSGHLTASKPYLRQTFGISSQMDYQQLKISLTNHQAFAALFIEKD